MPRIKITEKENISSAQFDATENTVLIPMPYARTFHTGEGSVIVYDEAENISGLYFSTAADFESRMKSHLVYLTNDLIDRSYIMAYELLLLGMTVVIKPMTFENATKTVEGKCILSEAEVQELFANQTKGLAVRLKEFKDRNIFPTIKFVTTGGYVNFEKFDDEAKNISTFNTIVDVAKDRGDAIALVEFKQAYSNVDDVINTVDGFGTGNENQKLAAAFLPWCKFNTTASGSLKSITMPACFAYLATFANSVQTNADWFAVAGANRGLLPNLDSVTFEVGEALMHVLQGDSKFTPTGGVTKYLGVRVNPIYNAGTYGYCIWGNRVLYPSSTVTNFKYQDFLNVRVLLCDIKKQIFHSAMRTTFEPNDDIAWINFKSLVNTLLDKMKSGRGLKWYGWNKEVASDKALIKATLSIKPIEAVESFEVEIFMTDEEVTVKESETI